MANLTNKILDNIVNPTAKQMIATGLLTTALTWGAVGADIRHGGPLETNYSNVQTTEYSSKQNQQNIREGKNTMLAIFGLIGLGLAYVGTEKYFKKAASTKIFIKTDPLS